MALIIPLWLTIATGPSAGSISENIVEKLATAPVPKFASPCELGPTTRIPAARARATIARSASIDCGSLVSPNPEVMMIAVRTPLAAHSSMAAITCGADATTIARSGASASEVRLG